MAHENNGTIKKINLDDGIYWLAMNTDTSGTQADLAGQIPVILLADLFDKTPASIARRIIRFKSLNNK